jgi:hypothetical protein
MRGNNAASGNHIREAKVLFVKAVASFVNQNLTKSLLNFNSISYESFWPAREESS